MGSLVLDIIRQGVLASLTGGWYYDPHHGTFTNTVHLYVFLFFLCFPLTVSLYFPVSVWSWLFYVVVTGILVISLKITNCALHRMYDTTEGQYDSNQETNLFENETRKLSQKSETQLDEEEGIEMQILNSAESQRAVNNGNVTRSNSDSSIYAPMMPYLEDVPVTGTIDLKVDVHRRNSSGSSQESAQIATTICETGDVTSVVVQPRKRKFLAWCQEIGGSRQRYVDVGVNTDLETEIHHTCGVFQHDISASNEYTSMLGTTITDIASACTIIATDVTTVTVATVSDTVIASSSVLNTIYTSTLSSSDNLNSPILIFSTVPFDTVIQDTPTVSFSPTDFVAVTFSDNLAIVSNVTSSTDDTPIINTYTTTTAAAVSMAAVPSTIPSNVVISATSPGRLCEKSRRFSVSATLGGTQQSIISDAGPALSLQLDEDLTKIQEEEKGLLFWKQRWENKTQHSKSDSIISPNEEPSMYKSDTVYSIEERGSEYNNKSSSASIADNRRESVICSEEEEEEEDHNGDDERGIEEDENRNYDLDNEDAEYGDVDEDEDNSRSPLLVTKRKLKKISSSEMVKTSGHPLADADDDDILKKGRDFFEGNPSISTTRRMRYLTEMLQERNRDNRECNFLEPVSPQDRMTQSSPNLRIQQQHQQQQCVITAVPLEVSDDTGQFNILGNGFCDSTTQTNGPLELFNTNTDIETHEFVKTTDGNITSAVRPNIIDNEDNVADDTPEDSSSACKNSNDNKVNETNEASSSGSNNELSSLLPSTTIAVTATITAAESATESATTPTAIDDYDDEPMLIPSVSFVMSTSSSPPLLSLSRRMAVRFDPANRTRPRRPRRQRPSLISGGHQSLFRSEGAAVLAGGTFRELHIPASNPYGRHVATSHEDTADGAVHLFQDENGEWMSYMFDSAGGGAVVVSVGNILKQKSDGSKIISTTSLSHSNAGFDSCTMFVNAGLRSRFADDLTASTSSYRGPMISSAESSATRSHLYQIREHEAGSVTSFSTIDYTTLLSTMQPSSPLQMGSSLSPTLSSSARTTAGVITGGGGSHMLSNAVVAGIGGSGVGSTTSREIQVDLDAITRANRFDFMDCLELAGGGGAADDRHRSNNNNNNNSSSTNNNNRYYKLRLFSRCTVKVYFNRLQLLALFDYNRHDYEILMCVFLSLLVSCLGALMLFVGFYRDIGLIVFCFVIAGSQYSLLKSVQPDVSSPTHGFNKTVAYSRPVYFIVCAALVLMLHFALHTREDWTSFVVYGVNCYPREITQNVHDFLVAVILYVPLIFAFGMFPQFSTFTMYFCEQIDMHLFGGNAVVSLKAGIYCLFRSSLSVLMLFGFAYAGLNEPKSTQHILFSIFVSLLVIIAYHLSRSTSDPEPMWNILQRHFWPEHHSSSSSSSSSSSNVGSNGEKDKRGLSTKNKSPKRKRSEKQLRRRSNIEDGTEVTISSGVGDDDNKSDTLEDPLPSKLSKTVDVRLQSDIIVSFMIGIILFAIHRSMVFSALQPELNPVMWCTAVVLGFILHYLIPQMRKQLPWMCIAKPILVQLGMEQFEPREPSKVTHFEKVYIYLGFIERNIIYPVMFIGCMTSDGPVLTEKLGPLLSSLLITLCGLKCLRLSFSNPSYQYIIVIFTVLLFQKQYLPSETFVIDYFLTAFLFTKIYDLILKIKFVMTYIAPWQITWGSAFHAFAQPFSLPHTGILFAQVVLSGILSSPLYPFLGSAIFLTSYPRPIKFWERDYNTRRADHSNTKLSSHLERNLGADDNNLNSIFYEHLTRSLQHSLCGDLLLGRWGEISSGDCFVLASDYLNCMIHIVEFGNGFVTFQMRGLEFRGTYCQQREVEAITEGVGDDDGCCCCNPGHLPNMLALNVAFNQRWLAWEVIGARYVVEGYSISDNSASSILQVFDFRKMLIIYYVKSIIYYAFTSPKLEDWLSSSAIMDALQPLKDKHFIDVDPVFNVNIDEDYDCRLSGISRSSFYNIYGTWIRFCNTNKETPLTEIGRDSDSTTFCYALSLLGRRALGTASHNTAASVEFFLYGLHALFKGDFRIASARDEWVFTDMDLLHKVVAPAIRMALKLHQDHFMAPDEFESPPALYAAITSHRLNLIISHEGDPVWRKAVLSGMPSLLALRRVMDDGNDEYKVIMLNKRYLSFRLIKLNRECVRGLWAGQQQELIYMRNRNPERGSIQNAKQVLRNIINSSCDQPIGYPIFVSPLTTSYVETNEQIRDYFGGPLSLRAMKNVAIHLWRRIRHRCIEGCSSGSSVPSQDDGGFGNDGVYAMTTFNVHSGYGAATQLETSIASSGGTITRVSRASITAASVSKPGSTSLVSLAGFLSPAGTSPNTDTLKSIEKKTTEKEEEEEKETVMHRVRIVDPVQIHDGINQGRLIDVIWPDEVMRQRGGRNFWKDWVPEVGMEGQVVHRWVPNHPNPNKRSTFDRTILLVKIDDKYVPISESGVQDLGAEV